MLTSVGLAPATEETVQKLEKKHPARSEEIVVSPPANSDPISLSKAHLFNVIHQSPRGSGAGPSGWCYEHFKVLIKTDEGADLLHSACSVIAKGILPDTIGKLLSSSRLLALRKPNKDVHPIVIGETMRNLTARAICLQKKSIF